MGFNVSLKALIQSFMFQFYQIHIKKVPRRAMKRGTIKAVTLGDLFIEKNMYIERERERERERELSVLISVNDLRLCSY